MKMPKYLESRMENKCIKTTEQRISQIKELMKIIIMERKNSRILTRSALESRCGEISERARTTNTLSIEPDLQT